jgi:transcriptional regulator with GAF, ATPase, and Fis domain
MDFNREETTMDHPGSQLLERESLIMLQTNSALMCEVFEKVNMVAQTQTSVLLLGETGTGKGVVARLIHERSLRSHQKFVSVHCGTIPEALIESELFGHEKGAFTGAIRRKLGKFETAKGGTIFLDEVGTITATTQIKLLQVLQDRTFQPVGGEKTITTDLRVIAASNIDLKEMCQKGEFRADLYYRLNVFPIHIPSLQERQEDIPFFLDFFMKHFNLLNPRKISSVSLDVVKALQNYSWPGNIRELENLIQRAMILEKSPVLTRSSFPQELFLSESGAREISDSCWPTLSEVRRQAIENAERQYLCSILTASKGRINKAAQIAGVSRRQIHKLLTRYRIDKNTFKK